MESQKCYDNTHIFIFTADDGWSDIYDTLVPITGIYDVPFVLGIIYSRLGTEGFITRDQLREMSTYTRVTIASHTMDHLDQRNIDTKTRLHEICTSRTSLQNLINKPISTLVYPSGRYTRESMYIAEKCGYTTAFTTIPTDSVDRLI
jgi:peptidoglycan/xylan/chitin deacetylase (PgdA/CDA1 family)